MSLTSSLHPPLSCSCSDSLILPSTYRFDRLDTTRLDSTPRPPLTQASDTAHPSQPNRLQLTTQLGKPNNPCSSRLAHLTFAARPPVVHELHLRPGLNQGHSAKGAKGLIRNLLRTRGPSNLYDPPDQPRDQGRLIPLNPVLDHACEAAHTRNRLVPELTSDPGPLGYLPDSQISRGRGKQALSLVPIRRVCHRQTRHPL